MDKNWRGYPDTAGYGQAPGVDQGLPLDYWGQGPGQLSGETSEGESAMIVRHVRPWNVAWNTPPNSFAQMRRDMESLLERLTGATGEESTSGLFPPMNVSEDRDHYYVRALIPGVDAAKLQVSVAHQTIAVSGTRESPEERGVSYHRKERVEGAFSRSVTLPESFDGARIDAKYIDGVLTLTLPKQEAAKPRRVTVQTS